MFGPFEFTDLDSGSFDAQKARNRVQKMLENRTILGEAGNQICVHGFRVMVKERTLKRGSSLLKHARFLQNLVVAPVFPAAAVEEGSQ